MSLWIVFITGLSVGGLTCLAVQGGLLASVIAARENEEVQDHVNKKSTIVPTVVFLTAKLVAYTVLGFILGAFGGVIGINQTAQILLQLLAGIYMVAIALNLLNVHPIFRYAVIQPPKFLARHVRNQSKSKELFAPALLGAMTIFIPCGTTLAMEALAISSANGFMGAAIMGTFVLGTVPLFFGIGWLTSVLGDAFQERFLRLAAVVVMYLGVSSVNGALIALDFPVTSQTVADAFVSATSPPVNQKLYSDPSEHQFVEIAVSARGYAPNYVQVQKGAPVTVRLTGTGVYNCASAFRVPSLGITKDLQANEEYIFTFTPQKTGKIRFACSMGMYTGVIEVI